MPYKARLLLHDRQHLPGGAIVEMKVWSVRRSTRTPEGYKYSFVYVDAKGRRLIGYDNAESKGHHRHERDREHSVAFESLEATMGHFLMEVKRLRGLA